MIGISPAFGKSNLRAAAYQCSEVSFGAIFAPVEFTRLSC
jgi:hypothetical protein